MAGPARPTPRPWAVVEDGDSIWIEGPEGSAATDRMPLDRLVVADATLHGDEGLDGETRANFDLIVGLANGAGS